MSQFISFDELPEGTMIVFLPDVYPGMPVTDILEALSLLAAEEGNTFLATGDQDNGTIVDIVLRTLPEAAGLDEETIIELFGAEHPAAELERGIKEFLRHMQEERNSLEEQAALAVLDSVRFKSRQDEILHRAGDEAETWFETPEALA